MAGGVSLSMNSQMVDVSGSGAGGVAVAVGGCFDLTHIALGATSIKLQGSSDGGSTYGDIEYSQITGDGTVPLSLTLIRCPFDHVKAVTSASSKCVALRKDLRVQPTATPTLVNQRTITGPMLGSATATMPASV